MSTVLHFKNGLDLVLGNHLIDEDISLQHLLNVAEPLPYEYNAFTRNAPNFGLFKFQGKQEEILVNCSAILFAVPIYVIVEGVEPARIRPHFTRKVEGCFILIFFALGVMVSIGLAFESAAQGLIAIGIVTIFFLFSVSLCYLHKRVQISQLRNIR